MPLWIINRIGINPGKVWFFQASQVKQKEAKVKTILWQSLKLVTDEKHNEMYREIMEDKWYILGFCT